MTYNVGKNTEDFIKDKFSRQEIIILQFINAQFKKVAYHWVDEDVPAFMRTDENIGKNKSFLNFVFYDFMIKYAKGDVGYCYRKGKNTEELLIREGEDEWRTLEKRAVKAPIKEIIAN